MSNKRKVLAFFGEDLESVPTNYLSRCVKNGWELLPLNTTALVKARSENLKYSLIEDWLTIEQRTEVRCRAWEWSRIWYGSVSEYLSFEGICWPEFDRYAMMWFWQEVALVDALGNAFINADVYRLRYFKQFPQRPGLYYYPADIYATYWESQLGEMGITCEAVSSQFNLKNVIVGWLKVKKYLINDKEVKNVSDITFDLNKFSVLKGKIVLVFNVGEVYRFKPIIQKLCKLYPDQLAVIVLANSNEIVKKVSLQLDIPVVGVSSHQSAQLKIHDYFHSGFVNIKNDLTTAPLKRVVKFLEFHFEYYCLQRWPNLISDLESWHKIWDYSYPRVVIISSLDDAESQLPAVAANRLDISTFCIPHGAVSTRLENQIGAKKILYFTDHQRFVWSKLGISGDRLYSCRDINIEQEYSAKKISISEHHQDKTQILILTNPVSPFTHRVLPDVTLSAQIEGLNILANPPMELKSRISVSLKAHPKWPEIDLVNSIVSEVAINIYPENSNIFDLLEKTDLVVALNYDASALFHAIKSGKPIIYLWLDPLIGFNGSFNISEFWLGAGEYANNGDDFWGVVKKFIDTSSYAEHLCSRAKQFTQDYLDTSSYQSLRDLLNDEILRNKHHV